MMFYNCKVSVKLTINTIRQGGNMPVFDFSGSDNKNKNIVTYETFQSSESTATAEKPIHDP